MKKLVLTLSLVLISLVGYAQATPVKLVRIQDATTPLDVNLSEGSHIYNMATEELWSVTSGIAGTSTITTGSASLKLVGTKLTQEEVEDYVGGMVSDSGDGLAYSDALGVLVVEESEFDAALIPNTPSGNLLATNIQAALNELQTEVDGIAGGSESTTVSDTAEIDLTLTGSDISGAIVTGSIDVLKLDAGVQASLALADSALQTEVDGSVTNEIQTLDQSQLSGRNLELSLSSDGEATKNIDLSSVNYTVLTESFEENDGTPTVFTLSQTAITGFSVTVSYNGTVLKPSNYTLTATTVVATGISVSQYDELTITYSY